MGGCAAKPRDVSVVYAAHQPSSGAIDVLLNSASGALSVTVNDALVVDRKHARKARIEGVPAGLARVQVATGGGCEKAILVEREVEVLPGGTVALTLPGPEASTACAVWAGLTYVGMNVGLVAVSVALAAAAATARVAHK